MDQRLDQQALRSFKLFYKKRLAYFCVARHKKIKQAYDVPST